MTGPTDVMDLGRTAVVADPTGAAVGLWQAGTFGGAGIVNEHGALIWNELNTRDVPAAVAFYTSVLPVTTAAFEMPLAGEYTELRVGGRAVAGLMDARYLPPGTPPHWVPYFGADGADDVDAIQAAAARAGAPVLAPAFDMAAGRMTVLAEPQGAVFAVITAQPGRGA
ncbi:VOC family protein [Streptomyces sp. NPDC059443]|uniref:VOC family protein n=1 Tax=unclassified Streptomyces TaxID=2593676 RepID=UPI0036BA4D1C